MNKLLTHSMKFRFDKVRHSEPKNLLPSLTQPDETMSVREIVERFVRGMDTEMIQVRQQMKDEVSKPMRDADFDALDMEKIQFMDVDQRMDLLREYQSRVQILKDKLSAPVKKVQGDARPDPVEPTPAKPSKEGSGVKRSGKDADD